MFKGGQKRLLPPIKNPLFNPNEDSRNEVRIATVVSTTNFNPLYEKYTYLLIRVLIVRFTYRRVLQRSLKVVGSAIFSVQGKRILQQTNMALRRKRTKSALVAIAVRLQTI